MKTARVLLIGLTLASLMVPLAQSAYYIGLNNFIAIGTNGIINFNQNFQAHSSYPHLNLFYFTQFIWGGTLLGGVGFSATDCNITVTNMSFYTLTYTVVAAGAGTQRVYYRGLGEPESITGGIATYAWDVTNVTTAGNTIVTLNWVHIAPAGLDVINAIPGYLPMLSVSLIVFAAAIVLMGTRGELEPKTVVAFIVLAVGVILSSVIIYQFIEALA